MIDRCSREELLRLVIVAAAVHAARQQHQRDEPLGQVAAIATGAAVPGSGRLL